VIAKSIVLKCINRWDRTRVQIAQETGLSLSAIDKSNKSLLSDRLIIRGYGRPTIFMKQVFPIPKKRCDKCGHALC